MTGRTQLIKKDKALLTGMNYTKALIVYLIIKGKQLIQISMDLWKVDLNLDLNLDPRSLEGSFFFNAVINLADKNSSANTVRLDFKKVFILIPQLFKLNYSNFLFKM